jgi:signal transduction histidine kinase
MTMLINDRLKTIGTLIYRRFLEPVSQAQEVRRHELRLNILLASVALISLAALATFFMIHTLFDTDDGVVGLIHLAIFGSIVLCLLYLSRKGWYQPVGYALVGTIWLAATALAVQWSVELPEVGIVYTLAIIVAAVILSSRAGLVIVALTTLLIMILSYAQTHHLMHPNLSWTHDLSQPDDVVRFIIVFAIIGLVSWLSNRETDYSLRRAYASEAALIDERNNLELAVAKRTRELERTQSERIAELQRFAEFGRLTSGLLHDLANPITGASLSLGLISKGQRSHLVHEAQKNVQHLERYIEAARRQLQHRSQLRSFVVTTELAQASFILKRRAQLAGVVIELPSEKLHLYGDPVKFNQLATNLMANAIDACAGRPNRAEKARIKVELSPADDGVVLSVTDWGNVIDEVTFSALFEPFYTTKQNQGTGLGLTIVKKLVETDFHGTICATSSKAAGTRFVARLHNTRAKA